MTRAALVLIAAVGCGGGPAGPTTPYPPRLAEGATVDGRREGGWVFTDHWGEIRVEGHYRGGLRDGTWTTRRKGLLVSEGSYRDGRADGRFRWYDDDGKVTGEATMIAGSGRWLEGECLDDLRHGEWTVPAAGAVVHFERGVAHGHWRFREEWGVTEGDFRDGKRHGPWVEVASEYYEMPIDEMEARGLPHVPRTPEYLAEPVRFFRGEYRDGRRVGVWTVSTADGAPYEWNPTLDYDHGDATAASYVPLRLPLPVDEYAEELGRCPYPRDDASGKPGEIPY